MYTTRLKGIIIGMESMGAKHYKTTDDGIYFLVPKGSEINDHEKLSRAKKGINGILGLKLFVKIID